MKMKAALLFIIALVITFAFLWRSYFELELASSAYYSQNDKREYEYYTPELFKMMPRISSTYSFQYISNHDARKRLYGIRFDGTSETEKLKSWLQLAGYKPQATCDTSAECWRKEDSDNVVSLYSSANPDYVVIQLSQK